MRLSLEQIEMFVTCAEAGSFSAAARKLKRAQSTVSAAITSLEVNLGTDLFDRSTKVPRLTPAGQTLVLEARAVLDRVLSLENHAQSLAGGDPTSITIAVDVPYHVIIPVLRDFSTRYPHVDVAMRHPLHGDIPRLVLSGEADLGVTFALPNYDQRIEFCQLGKLIMCHAAHRTHPLAQQAEVTFANLTAHQHIAHVKHATDMPTTEYLRSVQTWRADSYHAVIAMLRGGLGWATVPRQLILSELESGELVDLQLQAYPHTDYQVAVDALWSRNSPASGAVTWLRRRLQSQKVSEVSRAGVATTR